MGKVACRVAECSDPPRAAGMYCNRHRLRVAKYGTPDDTPRVRSYSLQEQALSALLERDAADESDQCWEWPGPRDRKGYGIAAPSLCRGSSRLAHRTSLTIAEGRLIPDGMNACHRCDNPGCYRPSHLFAGTPAENSADMAAKGRSPRTRNERSGRARLTDVQVAAIRAMRAAGATHVQIAAQFGIHEAHSSRICNGKRRPTEHPRQAIAEGYTTTTRGY